MWLFEFLTCFILLFGMPACDPAASQNQSRVANEKPGIEKSILNFEEVDREKKEERRKIQKLEKELKEIRQSPDWDGEEGWEELA